MTPATEQAFIAAANKGTAAGAVIATASGVAEKTGWVEFLGTYGTEIASVGVLFGMLCGATGLLIQYTFKWRQEKRDIAEHKKRMRQ